MSNNHDKYTVIRIAGDSGDGIQVIGNQFAASLSKQGINSKTMPDFPAEIRAPAGTIHGISGFQIAFSDTIIHTSGDLLDTLVALNPAAVLKNINDLKPNGLLVVDENKFSSKELSKLNLDLDYLQNLQTKYNLIKINISDITLEATSSFGLTRPQALKCRNMFALGIINWIYTGKLDEAKNWIKKKYKVQHVAEANIAALEAGYNFAITMEAPHREIIGITSNTNPENAIHITGNKAISMAIAYAPIVFKKSIMLSGYPITPSSDIIHEVAKLHYSDIFCIQAEDEIAAAGMALGACYGGNIGVTCTSGPGLDLKMETIGLAIMAELPLVVIDVQRAGPSTGMPTKNEQTDLLQAIHGRHGESPVLVMAANSPSDCFETFLEATYLSLKMMMPVIILSDAYIANSSEAWVKSNLIDLAKKFSLSIPNQEELNKRNNDGVKYYPKVGTELLMHRIGGLEKDIVTGNISYDPDNHQDMVNLRQKKLDRSSKYFQPLIFQSFSSKVNLLITWGSSYGPCIEAAKILSECNIKVDVVCLKHLNPIHHELTDIIKNYQNIVVCELNQGQLASLLMVQFGIKVHKLNKVTGQLFKVSEVVAELEKVLC